MPLLIRPQDLALHPFPASLMLSPCHTVPSVLQVSHPCSHLRTFALTPPLQQRSSHWHPHRCFYLRIQTLAQILHPQTDFPWWPSFLVSSRISLLICWLIIVLRPFPATAGGLVPLEPGALMSWAWLCNNTWHLLKRYLLSKRISGEAIVLHCFVLFCFFPPGCVYRIPLCHCSLHSRDTPMHWLLFSFWNVYKLKFFPITNKSSMNIFTYQTFYVFHIIFLG